MPSISVVIPTYNMARYLGRAIQSVLDQTFTDFELIVVDDGSDDDTPELMKDILLDSRVRYAKQENLGLPSARNTGIEAARGKYIAFLDADDFWCKEKLERQFNTLEENPHVGVVYCGSMFVDEAGELLPHRWLSPPSEFTLYEELLYANVVEGSGSSVLVRKECFEDVGLFDEALRGCEDQDMWRRLAEKYNFQFIDEPLVKIRVHPASMQAKEHEMALAQLRYLEKLRSDTPDHFRHHLPMVSHKVYWRVAYSYFANGNLLKGFHYLVRISLLGPSHLIKLIIDVVKFVLRRLGAKLAIVAK
jgi:glycosyltransferase involved in cell wall biosynthesis